MNIKVNGRECVVDKGMSLNELLAFLRITQRKGLAVAVNASVVPKSQLETVTIKEGDEIEVIRAVQGG